MLIFLWQMPLAPGFPFQSQREKRWGFPLQSLLHFNSNYADEVKDYRQ
jgi:hypothetical protein